MLSDISRSAVIKCSAPLPKRPATVVDKVRRTVEIVRGITKCENGLLFDRRPLLVDLACPSFANVYIKREPAIEISVIFSFTGSKKVGFPEGGKPLNAKRYFASLETYEAYARRADALVLSHLTKSLRVLRISLGLQVTVGLWWELEPGLEVTAQLMGMHLPKNAIIPLS